MTNSFPFKIIDLTHPLSSTIPTWNGHCGFQQEIKLDYSDCETAVKFRVQQLKMHSGIGTHIDAPLHCIANGKSVADLALSELISPCVMIDVSKKAKEGYLISLADLNAFEETYGVISAGSFVIFYTGWEKFWYQPEKYRCNYRYPSISKEVAETLLERKIAGVGIDTLSPDRPSEGYPVHHCMLSAGKYIIENIAYANQLPPISAYSLALPLKIEAGTEAPLRLIALLGEE